VGCGGLEVSMCAFNFLQEETISNFYCITRIMQYGF